MRSCDGRKKVEEMLKLCDDFEDLQYIACLRPLQRNQDIEHARQDCLELLITALTKNEPSLKGIIFEARRSQSDNDKDRNTLKRMRKKSCCTQESIRHGLALPMKFAFGYRTSSLLHTGALLPTEGKAHLFTKNTWKSIAKF